MSNLIWTCPYLRFSVFSSLALQNCGKHRGHRSLSLHLCYLISLLISNNQLPGWSKPLMPLAGNCLCAHASQINQISQWWLNSVGWDPDEDKFPHLPNSCSIQLISLGEKLTNRVPVCVFALFHSLVFLGFVSEELRTDVWRQKWRCVCVYNKLYIYLELRWSYIKKSRFLYQTLFLIRSIYFKVAIASEQRNTCSQNNNDFNWRWHAMVT